MAFDNHRHLFERSISGTFTDTIDCNFHLTGSIQHACHCVGGSHTQIIVAMGGNDSIMNTVHMFHQILYLRPILGRKAVPGGIGNINYRSARLDNSFHHTGQIFVIRTSGIFGIEFNILYITTGILYSCYRTLNNLLTIGVEFIFDMRIGSTDTRMNTLMFGKL